MNLWFSSSKTRKVEGCETLDEEAIVFFCESSIEDDEEDEREDEFREKGSWLMLKFTKSKEAGDMVNRK